jgi:hypothetical protein
MQRNTLITHRDMCDGDKVLPEDSGRIIDIALSAHANQEEPLNFVFIVPISPEDQATGTSEMMYFSKHVAPSVDCLTLGFVGSVNSSSWRNSGC